MPAINTLVDNIVSRLVQNNPAYSSNPQESAIPLQGGGQVTTPDYQSGNYSQPVSAVDWQPDLQGGAGQDRFAPQSTTAVPAKQPSGGGSGFIASGGKTYRYTPSTPEQTAAEQARYSNYVDGQQQQALDLRDQQNADFRSKALNEYTLAQRDQRDAEQWHANALAYAANHTRGNDITATASMLQPAQQRVANAANALGIEMKDAESMRGYDANKHHSNQALAGTKYTADSGVKGHQIAGKAQVQAARETALGHIAAANAKGEEGEDKEWSSAYNAYANSAHGKTVTKDEGFGEPTTITTQPDPERAKRDKERLFAITTQRIKKNKWSYNQAMDNLSSLWPEYVEFMNRGSSATPAKQPNFQQGVESALLLGGR